MAAGGPIKRCKNAPCKRFSACMAFERNQGSALGRLVVHRPGWALRCSANLRQDRLAIIVAVAAEEFLMGAERRHPSADLFAHVIGASRSGRANNRDGVRGPCNL